ncbi:phage late control D family protein [Pseudomonas lalucatii]|uniref:Phage late control D family protein n=1 Tax=Pseudomonas lalucatii TaxID=1424203 RepID=A0ABS5PVI3_9PSED|nr:phage late control D family protein [Pseudomonas lalucatii]MBS7660546.1 phage late control D family protein [Pseudomonas lalucatii]
MIDGLTHQALGVLRDQADRLRNDLSYARPLCRVLVDGRDITASISARLVSLTLTDNRGLEADQLDIQLSDHDGLLAIPPRGAVVRLWLGWSDSGLVDKGSYTVDEVEHSGAPDVLNIRARSADLREGLARKRERSWHGQTLGDIVRAIAVEYGLQPLVQVALAAIGLPHLDQTGESDLNLLTRLAREHDAIASIKAGRLLMLPMGKSASASGLALPHIPLTRRDGDQHRYLEADRDAYTGAKAYYYELGSAQRKEAIAGSDDNAKALRHTYADRSSALRAARAEWRRLQRGSATLSYTLAKGRPDLIPELTYSLTGIKAEIAAIVWLGGNVTHNFTPDAYTTSLELTSKLPDSDELTSDQTEQHSGVLAWYRDEKTGEQKQVSAGEQSNPKRLTHLYASKASAERAVEREWSGSRFIHHI